MIYLILTYSNQYYIEQKLKDYPPEWKEQADEVMKDNNKFEEWFYETFEVKEGALISKKMFESILNNSPYKNIKIKDELTRMKIDYKYDSQKTDYMNGTRYKGYWIGFKMVEEEINDDENF